MTEDNIKKRALQINGVYTIEAKCVRCKCTYTQYRGTGHYYTACFSCREIESEERRKTAPWWAGFASH